MTVGGMGFIPERLLMMMMMMMVGGMLCKSDKPSIIIIINVFCPPRGSKLINIPPARLSARAI